MKLTKIDLSQPFETLLSRVLALPANSKANRRRSPEMRSAYSSLKKGDPELTRTADIKRVVRCLYEAAHGRQVETSIGLIPIAPPLAPYLKERPLYIRTQVDFLLAALTRILEMSSRPGEQPFAPTQCETLRQPSISDRTVRLNAASVS